MQSMTDLNQHEFIRERLHGGTGSALSRYRALLVGDGSLWALLKLELITGLFGWVPGAPGLLLRKLFYPLLFAESGAGNVFGRQLVIRNPQNIKLGSHITIDDYALLDGRGAEPGGLVIGDRVIVGRYVILHSKAGGIEIGAEVNIGSGSVIVAQGGVRIGTGCQIAGGCKISGGLFRYDPETTEFARYSKGPIVIEAGCFLGGGVHITDGITIGQRAMIGTGSVVMSNIPAHSIYMPRPGMIMGSTVPQDSPEDQR